MSSCKLSTRSDTGLVASTPVDSNLGPDSASGTGTSSCNLTAHVILPNQVGAGPEHSGPVHGQCADPSNKRPRISNTSTERCPPKLTLMALPFEVLLEIFNYLRPGDLLSLARCKPLRKELMKKASQQAIANVRGLPKCPKDFAAPQFLMVLFAEFCTNCGGTEGLQVDTTLLVRLCPPCQDQCLSLLIDNLEVPDTIREFLHKSNVFGEASEGELPLACVLKSDVLRVTEARDKAGRSGGDGALKELEAQLRGEVLERKMLSEKIIYALELFENDLGWERNEIQKKRRLEIQRRCIGELNMNREDLQFAWYSPGRKKYYELLNKPKLLEDLEWGEIRSELKRLLIANRGVRAEELNRQREQQAPQELPGWRSFTLEVDAAVDGIHHIEGIEV